MRQRIAILTLAASSLMSAAGALVSCGGGGVVGSGGTGQAVSLTVGTVNGFGSVIVDGLSYDDSRAPVYREVGPGNDVLAAVKLGHRVSVEHPIAGVAALVRIDTTLAGAVTSAGTGQFTTLGQTVTVNTGSNPGPVTQFDGGYTRLSDMRVGDQVEVHGLLLRQPAGYLIQATRIEKLAASPTYLRVTGLAAGLSGATVALGALGIDTTGAAVLPTGTALANGQVLTVLVSPSNLNTAAGGTLTARASQIRVRDIEGGTSGDYISGALARLDTSARTFVLGSRLVRYGGATMVPAGTALRDGQYILVGGSVAADGVLDASSVAVRDAGSDSEGELKGNVGDYVAASKSFVVRGVMVDASTASLSACPASGLYEGAYVEVHGALVGTGVKAKSVECKTESAGATVERKGTVGSVDTAARTFTLNISGGTALSIKWSDTTYFGGASPATLTGKSVEVEGVSIGGVLMASKVEVGD